MTVLTKTENLVDEFRVRPTLQHGVSDPWGMPLFYTDERSVFFVTGDDQVYYQPGKPTHYYGDLIVEGGMLSVPRLYEEPVKPKIPKPGDPVFDPTWALQIPGNTAFVFGGTTFDAGGAVKKQLRNL